MASRQSLAKFTPPHLRAAMARPRLLELLDAARDAPAVWIEGAPGAGKTTLAATHRQARGLPCIWFRVDAADNDLAELVRALSTAAGRTLGAGQRLPVFTAEHVPQVMVFARRYFRALFDLLPEHCSLVFDDVHELEGGVALEALRIAIDEAPAGVQVLLLSRTAPPPRVRGARGTAPT